MAMRTPISYYGGKQSMLHIILPMIPEHDTYTEVFFGGGAVFWSKKPSKNETINDRSDLVVNFYKTLKNNYPPLKAMIEATLFSRSQHREALEIVRNQKKHDAVSLAWAFWMLTNFSFSNKIGGGIKFSNHQCTVAPEMMINKKNRFTELLVERIEHAHIECNDANVILNSRNVIKAFHYIDPPYFNADNGHYTKMKFGEKETIELFQTCSILKGKFLLSSYSSDIMDEFVLKNAWNKKEIPFRVQAPGKKVRKIGMEALVWNYDSQFESKKNYSLFETELA